MTKTFRGKYGNKSLPMQIFHKYTGFIVFGIAISIIAIIWYDYDSQQVYFAYWSCIHIEDLAMSEFNHNELDLSEHIRLHEIIDLCDEKFTEPIKHQ